MIKNKKRNEIFQYHITMRHFFELNLFFILDVVQLDIII